MAQRKTTSKKTAAAASRVPAKTSGKVAKPVGGPVKQGAGKKGGKRKA